MTDVFDLGQARDEEMRSDALAEQARRHPMPTGESARICKFCDEPIPEDRRRAIRGVQTCIECQTDIEKRGFSDWGMAE